LNPANPWFEEEYTAASDRIESARFLQECFRVRGVPERGAFIFLGAEDTRALLMTRF
jgi:hypothetical protein